MGLFEIQSTFNEKSRKYVKLEKNKHRYGNFTILKTCIFDQIIKQSNLTSKTLPQIST
jgi:hypothetical protein